MWFVLYLISHYHAAFASFIGRTCIYARVSYIMFSILTHQVTQCQKRRKKNIWWKPLNLFRKIFNLSGPGDIEVFLSMWWLTHSKSRKLNGPFKEWMDRCPSWNSGLIRNTSSNKERNAESNMHMEMMYLVLGVDYYSIKEKQCWKLHPCWD